MKAITKIFIFLLWAVSILVGYYYFHKPLVPEQFLQLLGAVTNLVGSLLILMVCGGLGYKMIKMPGSHPLTALSVQAALGAGMVSLVWLALGVAGLIRWWAALALLLVSLVVLRKEIIAWLGSLSGWTSIWQNSGMIGRIFLTASAFLVLNQAIIALAPPIKYDALSYHLALPSIYAAQARLVFLPENPYWGHPQLVEMLYTWIFALGGQPSAAAVLNWWCGVVFLIGLAGFTYEYLPVDQPTDKMRASAAGAAVVFILAGGTARWMLGWAYTDLFSAWMGLGVLTTLFIWHESGRGSWLAYAGVFTGLAVSTKYTAGIIAVALYLGLWLVRSLRKPAIKLWFASGLIAALIFLPWALKNLVYTANPLFPYLIPTQFYSAERLADANLPPTDYQLLPQLVLPVYLTWAGVDSAPGPSTDLGPLLVLFAIPGLFLERKKPLAQFLGFSLLITWLVMSAAGARYGHLNQPRLFFVLLPALAALAGWGWARVQPITTGGVRLGRLTAVIACLVLALVIVQDINHLLVSTAPQTVMGIQTNQAYLEENTGVYITAMRALRDIPANSRILMLWEARGLYAPPNTTPDPWIDQWRSSLRQYGSPDAVLANWRKQGYTHVLLYQTGMDFIRENDNSMTPAEWAQFHAFLAALPPPKQIAAANYLLYEIPRP